MSKFMSPSEFVKKLAFSLQGVYNNKFDEINIQRSTINNHYIDGRKRFHATIQVHCQKDKPYQVARATVDLIVRQDKEVTVFVSSPSFNEEIVWQSDPDSANYWLTDVEKLLLQKYNNDNK